MENKIITLSFNEVCRCMDVAGSRRLPFFFVLDFEKQSGYFFEEPLVNSSFSFDFCGRGNSTTHCRAPRPVVFNPKIEPFATYCSRFDTIRQSFLLGNSFLANLTVATPLVCNLSLEEIYRATHAPYRLLIPGCFVCFSPERFVFIDREKISTNPMKGTIADNDPASLQELMDSPKEQGEHYTIVDLMRNDLSRVASSVKVNRFRYAERIRTLKGNIWQTSSEISGVLRSAFFNRFGSIMQALLPAGSISGAPKEATIAQIRKAEGQPRGFYTGVAGYYDGCTLDSAVLIRFIEQQLPGEVSLSGASAGDTEVEPGLVFRAGGGITIHSRVEAEYDEVAQKVYIPL